MINFWKQFKNNYLVLENRKFHSFLFFNLKSLNLYKDSTMNSKTDAIQKGTPCHARGPMSHIPVKSHPSPYTRLDNDLISRNPRLKKWHVRFITESLIETIEWSLIGDEWEFLLSLLKLYYFWLWLFKQSN